jgi:hypothetical protein
MWQRKGIEMNTKELEPFDFERAKAGEPIVFWDGSPAKFIAYIPYVEKEQRVVVSDARFVYTLTSEGKSAGGFKTIFMAPKKKVKKEGWINLYKKCLEPVCTGGHAIFPTKEEAKNIGTNCFLTIRIEWEEEE